MWQQLEETVRISVKFLDSIIDLNKFPDERIKKATLETRKIGLGIMGFADMLIDLKVKYGSKESVGIAKQVMKFITEKAHSYSEKLGLQNKCYPAWIPDTNLPARRNLTCTTIAPTGSLSILAGCSSGIEPNFDFVIRKNVFDTTIYEINQNVRKDLKEKYGDITDEMLERIIEGDYSALTNPNVYVKASQVSAEEHINVQAAFQQYTDNAVSKTINFPYSATKEDVRDAILYAYEKGCKGLTIYRDGSRSVQVLESAKKEKPKDGPSQDVSIDALKALPAKGIRYTQKSGCGTVRVSIFDDPSGEPFEVFIGMGKSGGCASAFMEVLGRLVSTALQEGVKPEKLINQLTGISCTQHSWSPGGRVLSCIDGVGSVLQEALCHNKTEEPFEVTSQFGQCPDCGAPVINKEGCVSCSTCFWSQCS